MAAAILQPLMLRLPASSRRPTMSVGIDVLAGRALAMCLHPYAAWRTRSARGRAFVVCAYGIAGYTLVLGLLLAQ